MRVVHVLNHFLPYTIGGIEIYVWSLSKQQQILGYKTDILIPNYGKDFSESYSYDNITVCKYAEPTVVNRNLIFGKSKSIGLKSFFNYLISDPPDVVHFHHIAGSNGITAEHIRITATLNVKIVFTAHLVGQTCFTGSQLFCGKYNCDGTIKLVKCTFCFNYTKKLGVLSTLLTMFSYLLSKLDFNFNSTNKITTALNIYNQIKQKKQDFQTIIDSSHVIIAISKWYYDTLLQNKVSLEKLKFIPQSLPKFPNEYQLNGSIHNKSRPLNILYIGRIISEKGLHILLDALFSLNSDDYRLDIYGPTADLKYEQDLKSKCTGYGNINWKGSIVHDEVIKIMINYDLLCMCSIITEMSPLVIQESFAAGLPVLASDVPGNKELISHEVNGLLFKNGSKESLQNQLKRCFLNSSILTDIRKNIRISNDSRELAISYDSIYKSPN